MNNNNDSFEVINFDPYTNTRDSVISLDYSNAISNGFIIPSVKQISGGEFAFEFGITNDEKPQSFYYKIFYQNESYKFEDDSILSNENFYGSWEDTGIQFKSTGEIADDGKIHIIKDKIRIVGNPLNDSTFFGDPVQIIDSAKLAEVMKGIEKSPDWFKSIKEKAKQNNITVQKQLFLDALFVVKEQNPPQKVNHRWKRNPRVGKYSFMVVVCTEEAHHKIPDYIKDISLRRNGQYVNPYYYFLHGKGSIHKDIVSIVSTKTLHVKANVDLLKGIFVNADRYNNKEFKTTYFNEHCNYSSKLNETAQIEQFIHNIDETNGFKNIPVSADITGDNYTVSDYIKNNNYSKTINVPIAITPCPCKTVGIDSVKKSIYMINPGNKPGEFRKENVGIITRHGFTYGKFRIKVKLTELLNKYNLWNGLTNAIWLYRQSGEWNQRRICFEKGGYIPKDQNGENANRTPRNQYSEIDIEIVKGPRNWPKTSYNDRARPEVPITDSNKIAVTYTNWDLACKDAKKFNIGVHDVFYENKKYEIHRWDHWYQAVTGKHMELDDELFKRDYYWFEIEWKPSEIIWRMGPEKNKLKTFGYVNSDVSSIPNNQMLLAITQEWHLSNWWPEAPFDQNRIPFPSKDIKGEVLEIEIE